MALYGSGLQKSAKKIETDNSMSHIPGIIQTGEEPVTINARRKIITLEVTNTGTRGIQVGSHCNFSETNKALAFDRRAGLGYRLNIPAGTTIRFEPGETKFVELVEIGGEKLIYGGNNLVNGKYEWKEEDIMQTMKEQGFVQ